MRKLSLLALLAVLPLSAPTWAGNTKPRVTSADTGVEDAAEEAADEPALVIPKEVQRSREPSSNDSPVRSRSTPSRSTSGAPSRATAATASRATYSQAAAKRDNRVMPVADDEGPAPIKPKSTTAASAPKSRKPAAERAPQSYGNAGAPPLFEGPNPGYHPARVARHSAGWYWTGTEPAAPAPEPEVVPAPGSTHGNPSMPYAGDDGFVPDQFSADDFGDGFDPGSYSGGGPFMGGGRRWAVIAGADAMMVRTHYSQSTALDSTSFIQTNTGNIFNQKYTAFSPGYQGAFRTFIGLRDCCCGNEYRFGFMNLNAAQRLHSTTTTTSFDCDFLCNVAANPGDSINTGFNQGLSLFDFDVIRPFFFNPPCGDCCAPTCPVWDLRWFAGARIAYINQSINAIVTDATNVPTGIGFDDNASLKFTGGGLRMGMQGRRYLGATGRWSLYGRGAGSLLVGNINQHVSSFQPNGPANPIGGDSLITVSQHQSRIIPVAEIEAGATWWILPRFSVSGGWFLMSFWDLGMQVTGVNGNIGGGGGGVAPNNHPAIFDDSNILGFDGFFVRGELVF